jgi:hypothetical protein
VGCGTFVSVVCGDGSNGISDTFINSANGCTVRAYNILNGLCAATIPTFNVTVQARCLSVPKVPAKASSHRAPRRSHFLSDP